MSLARWPLPMLSEGSSARTRATLLLALTACTGATTAATVGTIAVANAPAISRLSSDRGCPVEQPPRDTSSPPAAPASRPQSTICRCTYHVGVSSDGVYWSNHCGYCRYYSCSQGPGHQQSQCSPYTACKATHGRHRCHWHGGRCQCSPRAHQPVHVRRYC